MEEFKAKLPQQDGLLLRPQVREKLRLSLQKKTSTGTKPLPPPSKRGRKKQSSDYRNRVGRKAQSLRKVQIQCTCTPLLYSTYILLHDWEGNMGKYSARWWQYWPDRREGQYRTRELNIFPYCPTLGSAIIDLLYDWTVALYTP